jgi:hypothetical protein
MKCFVCQQNTHFDDLNTVEFKSSFMCIQQFLCYRCLFAYGFCICCCTFHPKEFLTFYTNKYSNEQYMCRDCSLDEFYFLFCLGCCKKYVYMVPIRSEFIDEEISLFSRDRSCT